MKNISAMRKISFLLLLFIFHFNGLKAQIIIDNNAPYDNPAWMVDNILLGGELQLLITFIREIQCK